MAIVNEHTITIGGKSFSAFMDEKNAKIAAEIIDAINNPVEKYHTYFVSYIENVNGSIRYGNKVFATTSTGQLLAMDAVHSIEYEHPHAVVLSINKLD